MTHDSDIARSFAVLVLGLLLLRPWGHFITRGSILGVEDKLDEEAVIGVSPLVDVAEDEACPSA